jgi:hypothetical protein
MMRLAFAERISLLCQLADGRIEKLVVEKRVSRNGRAGTVVTTRICQVDDRTRLAALELLARYGVGTQVKHDANGQSGHTHYVVRAPIQATLEEWDRRCDPRGSCG